MGDDAVAEHRDFLLVFRLVEDLEFAVRADFKEESHGSGEHHRDEDAQRFQQHVGVGRTREVLVQGHPYRQAQGNQQDPDDAPAKTEEQNAEAVKEPVKAAVKEAPKEGSKSGTQVKVSAAKETAAAKTTKTVKEVKEIKEKK